MSSFTMYRLADHSSQIMGFSTNYECWSCKLSRQCRGRVRQSVCVRMVLSSTDKIGTASQRALKQNVNSEDLITDAPEGGVITIPVSLFQIIGLQQGASEEQILASYNELKSSNVDGAYTVTGVLARQELLEDVISRLLLHARHSTYSMTWNRNMQISTTSMSIPLAWLAGALALLEEVGEEEAVLNLGNATLQERKTSLYHHDIMVAMALSKCTRARKAFECGSITEGFEALVQAHQLLKRGKSSLHDNSLVAEIEASLEEMAPACTLEHLRTSNEHRTGALAALSELLRQGLSGEPSCSVHNWQEFVSQAISRLRAQEIVELLPWENLLDLRKQSAEQQRNILSTDCMYTALVAHIAVGFFERHPLLIEQAGRMAHTLTVADDVDLRVERAICSVLLGHSDSALKRLKKKSTTKEQEIDPCQDALDLLADCTTSSNGELPGLYAFTEIWLQDQVLQPFQDTQSCNSSLSDYYNVSEVKNYFSKTGGRTMIEVEDVEVRPSLGTKSVEMDTASVKNVTDKPLESIQIRRLAEKTVNLENNMREKKMGKMDVENKSNLVWKILVAGLTACAAAAGLHSGKRISHIWPFSDSHICKCAEQKNQPNGPLAMPFGFGSSSSEHPTQRAASNRRNMPAEEAEELIRHWQAVKAVSLGPEHAKHCLPEILGESMLSQWQALTDEAKAGSCYWRFVLLNLTVVRADIFSDELGWETAELEAILEEAAELVADWKLTNPNYYSTYRATYQLHRCPDRTWRICQGKIQPV